jgi:hypothetical protein
MIAMDAGSLTLLLSPQGRALLAALPPYDEALALPLAARLREEGVDPALAAAALTQARLRDKAAGKFGAFADEMYFTADGLEQATRLTVAALHARRYLAASCTRVADLTCGVGADSLAFGGVGLRVLAAEIDAVTAAIAKVNLRAFPEVEVRNVDGLSLDLAAEGVDGVYADPARRRGGSRVFDPAAWTPPLDAIWGLRETVPAVGVKVGPGIAHGNIPREAEAQWVSVDGDVVECGLWFGPLAPEGAGRSALLLTQTGNGTLLRQMRADWDDEPMPPVGPVGEYLFEPDGSVIRAGLVAQAAAEVGGRLLDPKIAYISADSQSLVSESARGEAPIVTGYRVIDSMPYSVKRLKQYLRERNVGRVAIKKRGIAVTPEQLRPQLALRGDEEATIVLTRVVGKHTALIVEPLKNIE